MITGPSRGLLASMLLRKSKWTIIPVAIAAVTVMVLPPILVPASLAHLWLRHRPDRVMARVVILAALPLAALAVIVVGAGYTDAWRAVLVWFWVRDAAPTTAQVASVALWAVGAGPIVGAMWWGLDQRYREAAPVAGPEERARRLAIENERRRSTVHAVQRAAHGGEAPSTVARLARAAAVPLTIRDMPVIGLALSGDLRWPITRRRHLALLPWGRVHHVVVLGATGTGKSEITWRVVEAEIRRGNAQVIMLNCKQPGPGSEPAVRLAGLAERYGRTARVLVRGSRPYNVMAGRPDDVRDRLLGTEVFTEPYYRHACAVLTSLALDLHAAAGQPLSTLPDLVYGVARHRLAPLAQSDPRAAELLDLMEDRDVRGAVLRWASQTITLRGWVGDRSEGGWTWGDADVIGVDLPTSTHPEAATALLRAMLTDLEQWLADPTRRPAVAGRPRDLVLVIEEISALDDDPILARRIVNLVERARSANCRVIVVAQGPSGLGDERAQEALLSNCAVITTRQTDSAAVERLANLAGTIRAPEASVAYRGHLAIVTGAAEGSIRVQDQYRVRPDMLRSLDRGEVLVLDGGRYLRVAVGMADSGYRAPGGPLVRALLPELAAARLSPSPPAPGGSPQDAPAGLSGAAPGPAGRTLRDEGWSDAGEGAG